MDQHRSCGAAPLGKNGNNAAVPGQRGCAEGFWLLRTAWEVSVLPGLQKCHRVRYGPTVPVYGDGQRVWYGGFCRCHSVWACPLCAPMIRRGRAVELSAGLVAHLQGGGGAVFMTKTIPHDEGDRLAAVFEGVAGSWRDVLADFGVKSLRRELGFEFVRAAEVTYGENGWHPHLHSCLVTPRPLVRSEVLELRAEAFRAWCSAVERRGWRPPSESYGLSLIRVAAADGAGKVGDYVSKVEGLADELTRLDSKQARKGLSPFGILRAVADGHAKARALWSEYETATKGRRALTVSRKFRSMLGLGAEATDEELCDPSKQPASWLYGELEPYQADLLVRHPQGFEVFAEAVGPGTPEAWRAALEALRGTMPWWCTEEGWRRAAEAAAEEKREAKRRQQPVQGTLGGYLEEEVL